MAWIESHQELGRHPKTKRVARKLGVSIPAVVGHLHFLWWWALDYAEDGDLSAYEPEDIAEAAAWEDDPDLFVGALVDCGPGDQYGFLERDQDGLSLHDWYEYVGELLESRAARSEAGARGNHERWHVKRGIIDPNCTYCESDSQGESPDTKEESHIDRTPIAEGSQKDRKLSHRTVPNRTVPNRTVPNRTKAEDAHAREAAVSIEDPPDAQDPPTAAEVIGDESVTPPKFYETLWSVYSPSVDIVVQEFEDKLQPSAIKWAMWDAYMNDSRGAKYLKSIFERLERQGLTTAEKAEANEQKRKRANGKSRASPENNQGRANAGAYETVSSDLVAKWKELYPDEYD